MPTRIPGGQHITSQLYAAGGDLDAHPLLPLNKSLTIALTAINEAFNANGAIVVAHALRRTDFPYLSCKGSARPAVCQRRSRKDLPYTNLTPF